MHSNHIDVFRGASCSLREPTRRPLAAGWANLPFRRRPEHPSAFCFLPSAFAVLRFTGLGLAACCLFASASAQDAKPNDGIPEKLKSSNLDDVAAAVWELAASRDTDAPKLLGWLYSNGDAARRLLAIRALGKLGQPGLELPLFRVAVGDLFQAIRGAAADSLAQIESKDKATQRFIDATHDEKHLQPLERYRALTAVARLGGASAAACLREWIRSSDTDMATAAADGLAQLGDLSQAEFLIGMAGDKDKEVAPAVREALERLTGKKFGYDLVQWAAWLKEQRDEQTAPHKDDESPNVEIGPSARASSVRDAPADSSTGMVADLIYQPYAEPVLAVPIDLVIVYDTTGSMAHVWLELIRKAFGGALNDLMKNTPSLRVGTIKYRASDPRKTLTYMISPKPLTRDFDAILKDMKNSGFGGGSGGLDLGIKYAMSAMPWRARARKIILVVGDCSPDTDLNVCLRMIAEGWEMDGIIVDSLYIKTMHGPEHRATFRELANAGVGHAYEYSSLWQHIVDMTAEKPDALKAEEPAETAKKLCTPRDRTRADIDKQKPAVDEKPRDPPKIKASADDEQPKE